MKEQTRRALSASVTGGEGLHLTSPLRRKVWLALGKSLLGRGLPGALPPKPTNHTTQAAGGPLPAHKGASLQAGRPSVLGAQRPAGFDS